MFSAIWEINFLFAVQMNLVPQKPRVCRLATFLRRTRDPGLETFKQRSALQQQQKLKFDKVQLLNVI